MRVHCGDWSNSMNITISKIVMKLYALDRSVDFFTRYNGKLRCRVMNNICASNDVLLLPMRIHEQQKVLFYM